MLGLTINNIGSSLLQPLQLDLVYGSASSKTLVTSDGSGRAIVVAGYLLSRVDSNSGPVNLTFKDSTGASLWGPEDVSVQGNGVTQGVSQSGWFMTAPGANLVLAA